MMVMEILPAYLGLSGYYSLWVRLVETFPKVFLVESHGRDNASRCPIDHHISQQIIQGELPARHRINKISGFVATGAHLSAVYLVSVRGEFFVPIWPEQNLVPHITVLQWSHDTKAANILDLFKYDSCMHRLYTKRREHWLRSVQLYLPGQPSVLQVPEITASPCGELL